MTPAEYVQLRQPILDAIATLRKTEVAMRESAMQSPLPANLRPAEASDIQRGAIIWYRHGAEDDFHWQIVKTPRHYGDSFKAYESEDECLYGLHDAWVEIDS